MGEFGQFLAHTSLNVKVGREGGGGGGGGFEGDGSSRKHAD